MRAPNSGSSPPGSDQAPRRLGTLPALAAAVAEWFPELGGRAIAVSEAEVTPENIPTLPLVMVALQKETAKHNVQSRSRMEVTEDILVQFWVRPERLPLGNGAQSPFWAHYDYDQLRDALITRVWDWKSPRGERLAYKSMDLESDHFAVTITFQFEHTFDWCPDPTPSVRSAECLAPRVVANVRMVS